MNINTFVVFKNSKVITSVSKLLAVRGISVTLSSTSFAETVNSLRYYNSGLLICDADFGGLSPGDVTERIKGDFQIIVIGKREKLSLIEGSNVFKLATPMQSVDFLCTIDMLLALEGLHSSYNKLSREEMIKIDRAKRLLIDKYGMTEEKAHRYMQKKSMDTGHKLSEIAEIILKI